MDIKIDLTDRGILTILQLNGNVSNKEIGNKLHKSPSTIHGRRTRLEHNAVILKTSALLNPKLIGYGVLGYVHIKLLGQSNATLLELKNSLLSITGVCEAKLVTGNYGIKLRVVAEDSKTFNEIRNTIGDLPGVVLGSTYVELDDLIPFRGYYL